MSKATISAVATVAGAVLILLCQSIPTAAGEPVTPEDVVGPYVFGSAQNVMRLHHLWFAGQPDAVGFAAARDAGIAVVIDLRAPRERSWDEAPVVTGLGMSYYNVPVTGDAFEPTVFAEIERIVQENHDDEILIHCASSNRVGGWLAVHLVLYHGMNEEDALAVGRRAGITKPSIEERVRAYFADSRDTKSADTAAPPLVEGPTELQPQARRAQEALVPLKQGLQSALRSAMAESPESAVAACHIAVPSIEGAAQSPGIVVGRTSHRTRNPVNDPAEWMLPLVEHYLETPMSPRPPRVVDLGELGTGYVEPIYLQPLCETCHGSEVDPELLEFTRASYPHDRAVGFAPGELRGLFWVVVAPESAAPPAPPTPAMR